jgi:uncharacterized protein (TIGR02271 family)
MNELNQLPDNVNQLNDNPEESAVSKISLVEERLNIDIQKIETGKVQVHKKIVSEEISQQVPVTHEEIEVTHKAINQYVDAAPAIRFEGDTTIISVVKEVLVIEKKLMLVEEIRLSKKQITTTTNVTEVVRKEEIEINRIGSRTENTTTNQ